MKKSLFLLALSCVLFIGCSSSDVPQERIATEKYLKAKYAVLLSELDIKLEISSWNSTPIDTITTTDFYKQALRTAIEEANTYKKYTLYDDSMAVCRAYDDYTRNSYYHRYYNERLDKWTADKATYANLLNTIADLRKNMEKAKAEHLYYIYHFSICGKLKHPRTNENIENESEGYSYYNLRTNKVDKVDETDNAYIRSLEGLPSPIVSTVAKEDDLPELL